MRKAALASTLTLLLGLSTPPLLFHSHASAASPRDTSTGYLPYATDFVYPVGEPRITPNFDSTQPNGYRITQMFNNSCDPALGQGYYWGGQYFCGHTGVDLSNLASGGIVRAVANGLVVYAGYNSSYGEMVRIKHLLPSGAIVYSQYEHMEYGSLLVGSGQLVSMGQTIGYVGATGFVTGAHLHFEMKSVDEDGVGYTFGNAALIMGYYEPLSFVAAHMAVAVPTPTATLVPTAASTPSTQVLGLHATATSSEGVTAQTTGEHQAVLNDFYRRYRAYVTVTADHLNVRAGSGFNYTPLNSVTKGARLAYLGEAGNGWIHVALPSDVYGYVARQWVTGKALPKLPPIMMNSKLKPPYAVVLDTRYPARSGPMMHDPAIEVLKRGEKLTYLGTLGSWDKVLLPSGRTGWVLNWYLHEPNERINLGPAAHKLTCPCVVTTADGLRLRSGPSTSASIITTLHQGARLSAHSVNADWDAVTTSGGQQGYVMSQYVRVLPGATAASSRSTASGAVTCPCVVTTVDGLRLHNAPRLSAPTIEGLSKGTKLALRGYHGSWVSVTAPDGQQGYVVTSYVHTVGLVAPNAAPAVDSSTATTSTATEATTATTSTTTEATSATTSTTTEATAATTSTATQSQDAGQSSSTAPHAQDNTPPAPGFVAPFVYVNVDGANVRAAPDLKATVFVSQRRDTPLALLGTRDGWDHVETRKGVIGWVKAELTRASA